MVVQQSDVVLMSLGIAVAVAFAAGACSFPVLFLPRWARIPLLSVLGVVVLASPLLVPGLFTSHRLVASLAAIMIAVKLYDLHKSAGAGVRPSIWAFLFYLPNGFNVDFRRVIAERRPSKADDAVRALILLPITACCAWLIHAVWQIDWHEHSLIVEHCVKTIAVCAFIQFGGNVGPSLNRILGIPSTDWSGWFFLAATPAEFWRRWNRAAGQFMNEYLFKPAGGMRRPVLAVMTTFTINGLVHEYVFDVAAGRVLGWALAFFVVQGIAVIATMRFRPRGLARVAGIAMTLCFNLAVSVLFFRCVNAVLPFYVARR